MLPKEVDLCGRMHSIVEVNGTVLFSELDCVYGCPSKIAFSKRDEQWRVNIESHDDCAMVSQVLKAWSIVEADQGIVLHPTKVPKYV